MKPLVLLLTLCLGASVAHAESLTVEQIIEKLRPTAKTRSLSANRGISIEEAVQDPTSPTVNLYVNFDYNSANLKQDSLITLDTLAAALKDDRLTSFEFLVGGHTDAVGSEAYNLRLSEQRARAVKKYLVQTHSLSQDRLIEKGFGERRLLDPTRPDDGVNRRVQITTVSIPKQ